MERPLSGSLRVENAGADLSDPDDLSSAHSLENSCESPTPSDVARHSPRGSDAASRGTSPSPFPEPDFERWWVELGAGYQLADGTLPDGYRRAQRGNLTATQVQEIRQDLRRTFPHNVAFEAIHGPDRLYPILSAFALRNPSVGYCQGMNFIAGHLLIHAHKTWPDLAEEDQEERVFWMLCTIVESPHYNRGYYARSEHCTLETDLLVLREFCRRLLPKLFSHVEAQDPPVPLYHQIMFKWFVALFLSDPDETTSVLARKTWDVFVLEGSVTLFRCAIGLLSHCETEILDCKSTDILVALSRKVAAVKNDPVVVDQVVYNPERKSEITREIVDQLRNEYGVRVGIPENARLCPDFVCCPQSRSKTAKADRVCGIGGDSDMCVIA
eukprot:TRINITY_DN1534_c0_g1_i1.p1 TRINITY_DN1534_c0_g1~~TRINITY_DN1534_c0_g1_i1.p1  ORF type:complete len:384 (+),score=22.05 TRINITY_DN1534_c0_g1_i1:29-1180(+)